MTINFKNLVIALVVNILIATFIIKVWDVNLFVPLIAGAVVISFLNKKKI